MTERALDTSTFSHLTFDCYGTLIDWESGLLTALGGVFERHGLAPDEGDVLGLYAELEGGRGGLRLPLVPGGAAIGRGRLRTPPRVHPDRRGS